MSRRFAYKQRICYGKVVVHDQKHEPRKHKHRRGEGVEGGWEAAVLVPRSTVPCPRKDCCDAGTRMSSTHTRSFGDNLSHLSLSTVQESAWVFVTGYLSAHVSGSPT